MSKSALTPRRMGKRDRRRIAAIGLGPGIVVGSLRGGSEPYAAVIDEGHGVSGAIIAPTLHAKPEVVGRLESLLARGADLGAVAEALERVAGSGDSGDVLAQIGAEVERHALLAPKDESPWPGDWWFPGRRETSGFDLPISVTAPCALGHFNAGPADAPLGHLVTVYGEGCKRIAPWIGVRELMEAYEVVHLLKVALHRGEDPPRVAAALTMAAVMPASLSVLQRELDGAQS